MITKLIYAVFMAGILLSQWAVIHEMILGVKNRYRLRQDLAGITEAEENAVRGRFMGHLKNLMDATDMVSIYGSPEIFLCTTALIFTGVFFASYWMEGAGFSVMTGLAAASVPYLVMRIRLNKKRIDSSREGDIMLRELLSSYKINNCNMKEAIEATAAALEDAPNSKRLLLDMARGFNRAYTEKEIRKVLFLFRYSLATSWGDALASTIYFSHVHGIRVSEALEDLLESLDRSRKVVEFSRRENNEATLMLKYLAPASYLLSVLCACRYFGFSLEKFVRYQFLTPLGLQWFTISVVLFACGIIVNGLLSREKMDI